MKISRHILKIAKADILRVFPELKGNLSVAKIKNLLPAPDRDIESLGAYFSAETLLQMAGRELGEVSRKTTLSRTEKCKYMADTGNPKLKNHPCKGNAIICSHSEIGKEAAVHMTTKKCNDKNCKYFKAET